MSDLRPSWPLVSFSGMWSKKVRAKTDKTPVFVPILSVNWVYQLTGCKLSPMKWSNTGNVKKPDVFMYLNARRHMAALGIQSMFFFRCHMAALVLNGLTHSILAPTIVISTSFFYTFPVFYYCTGLN